MFIDILPILLILLLLNCHDSQLVPLLCPREGGLLLVTLLHFPVHDISDQRTCDQAQKLQRAEDGRVETH